MHLEIRPIGNIDSTEYSDFINTATGSMFFHTKNYHNLLKDFLSCSIKYLIVTEDSNIRGVLPISISSSEKFGIIINSLPFFGSPAGVVCDDTLSKGKQKEVYNTLIHGLREVADRQHINLATLLTSQFDPHNELDGNSLYTTQLDPEFSRNRVAQVVEFTDYPGNHLEIYGTPPDQTPTNSTEITTVGEYLFYKFEKRCRRAIRKSYSADLIREQSTDFEPLFNMHKAGMEAKGGTIKPYKFFDMVEKYIPSDQYKLSYAKKDGEIIAGLLTFRHRDTVEYHTPAYDYEHRSDQATSFLIFEAMKDAVQSGIKYWNFGGTRPTQESLYRFKRGWSAVEYPYHYYGFQFEDISDITQASPDELSTAFPWFYVYPFDELNGM